MKKSKLQGTCGVVRTTKGDFNALLQLPAVAHSRLGRRRFHCWLGGLAAWRLGHVWFGNVAEGGSRSCDMKVWGLATAPMFHSLKTHTFLSESRFSKCLTLDVECSAGQDVALAKQRCRVFQVEIIAAKTLNINRRIKGNLLLVSSAALLS